MRLSRFHARALLGAAVLAGVAGCGAPPHQAPGSVDGPKGAQASRTSSSPGADAVGAPRRIAPTDFSGEQMCSAFPSATAAQLLGVAILPDKTQVVTSGKDSDRDGKAEEQSGCYWYAQAVPRDPTDRGGEVPGAGLSVEPGRLADLVNASDFVKNVLQNCANDSQLAHRENVAVGGHPAVHLWCEGRDEHHASYLGYNSVLVDMGSALLVLEVHAPAGIMRGDPHVVLPATERALNRLG